LYHTPCSPLKIGQKALCITKENLWSPQLYA
jgi:hypothetical protein